MNLSSLKNKSSIDKLTKAIEKLNGGGQRNSDHRYWQPEVDKTGNGYAVIRFLDSPFADGEDGMPWVQTWNHGFQGPGGWLIENCPTSNQQKCPVCEENNKLWNTGHDSDKDIARGRKRKLNYVSNILVVRDPARPENEGKVFLYKYGKKIFDKLTEKLEPQFEDEESVNPFDFWKGANFKLKIRKVDGYRNYDKSELDGASPIGDDAQIEKIWKMSNSLKEVNSPQLFKSYEELRNKLEKVLGNGVSAASLPRPKPVEESVAPSYKASAADDGGAPWASTDEDDDAINYFSKLAAD